MAAGSEHVIALTWSAWPARFMRQLGTEVHRFGLIALPQGRATRAVEEHGRIIEMILARR